MRKNFVQAGFAKAQKLPRLTQCGCSLVKSRRVD